MAKLQALNAEIAIEEKPAREVAARYLHELGLKRSDKPPAAPPA